MKKLKLCLQHDGKQGREARPVHIRGRCKSCYEGIRREIRNGRMTEEAAVKQGWLLPVTEAKKARKSK